MARGPHCRKDRPRRPRGGRRGHGAGSNEVLGQLRRARIHPAERTWCEECQRLKYERRDDPELRPGATTAGGGQRTGLRVSPGARRASAGPASERTRAGASARDASPALRTTRLLDCQGKQARSRPERARLPQLRQWSLEAQLPRSFRAGPEEGPQRARGLVEGLGGRASRPQAFGFPFLRSGGGRAEMPKVRCEAAAARGRRGATAGAWHRRATGASTPCRALAPSARLDEVYKEREPPREVFFPKNFAGDDDAPLSTGSREVRASRRRGLRSTRCRPLPFLLFPTRSAAREKARGRRW